MRDTTILEGFNRMSDSISADNAKLQKGYALLRTRVDAIEDMAFGGRFSLLRLMILQLVSPQRLAQLVQAYHAKHIDRFNAVRAAAMAEKPKVMSPAKPIITKVL